MKKFRELMVGEEFKFNQDNAVLHRVSVSKDRRSDCRYYRNGGCVWYADDAVYEGDVLTKHVKEIPEQVIPSHTILEWA